MKPKNLNSTQTPFRFKRIIPSHGYKKSSAPLQVLRIFSLQSFFVFITMSANRIKPRLQQKRPHYCGLFWMNLVFNSFSVLLHTSRRRHCRVLPQRHIWCKKHRFAWQLVERERKSENGLPDYRTEAYFFDFFSQIG